MASTFFPETVLEGQVDSDFVIYGVANAYPVPQWVPEGKQKNCRQCADQLKSNHTHNCRLCGNLFCSSCTGKYHLPEKYEQKKGKSGPSRVCYGCKIGCVRLRQAALNLPLDSIQRTLVPPVWQDIKSYVACNKCCVKKRNPHNCRGCGKLACDNCSTKMAINLPPSFNLKKKVGSNHRMCDECRYRISAGARLDDGTQQQIQSFLQRQQSLGATPSTGASDTPRSPTEPLSLSNYGPASGPPVPTRQLSRPSVSTTFDTGQSPSTGIRIVYTNGTTGGQIMGNPLRTNQFTPDELTPRQHGLSISSTNPHQSYELNQIASSLNALSLDEDGNPSDLNPHTDLHNIHYDIKTGGSSTPVISSRTQRYAAANKSHSSTPTANGSHSRTPTEELIERPLLEPMGEELNILCGRTPQPRKVPTGGRDIFRPIAPATVPPSVPKTHLQTLDDQKEGDMDEETIPPPPPRPHVQQTVIDNQRLVKPSDLFAKLREKK
jgi:hypothetical protein